MPLRGLIVFERPGVVVGEPEFDGSFRLGLVGEVGEVLCGKPLKSDGNGDSRPSLPRICPFGTAEGSSKVARPPRIIYGCPL